MRIAKKETQQMKAAGSTRAVVLAGGSGNRLRHLTTDARGVSVPKQYCSLDGGPSLLELAMRRAEQAVAHRSITAIVAQQHQQWWSESLADLTSDNLIVQPGNRGTGLGILLSVLSILEQDPDARIVFLPSDHYVANEYILAAATRNALDLANRFDRDIVMIGITPESADPELGYIVPGQRACAGVFDVDRFVEKPERNIAQELLEARCYWNSFIFAAQGRYLLSLFEALYPHEVAHMRSALRADRYNGGNETLVRLYEHLPEIDFSRQIVERSTQRLKLVAVGACGWSDLGTPERVGETIRRLNTTVELPRRRSGAARSVWNLAQAYASLAAAV
jgi:mannose-1-phosphate guanylyltransferase